MIETLINDTRDFIAEQLNTVEKPVVGCSFGKDSMVMLALVREIEPRVPVIYYEPYSIASKSAFAEYVIRLWNLDVYRPKPFYREAIAKDGNVEVVELYQLAPNRFQYYPIEADENYTPDSNCLCALEKIHQPTITPSRSFDCLFIGHRDDDTNPTYGDVPLQDSVVVFDNFRQVYPLKNWRESDVWEATGLLGVPVNTARYVENQAGANNDIYPLCTECLKASDGFVNCPLSGGQVPALGGSYLERRREWWHQRFVNLAA